MPAVPLDIPRPSPADNPIQPQTQSDRRLYSSRGRERRKARSWRKRMSLAIDQITT